MAISCGFFNSLNGDRKYDAIQLSSIFDGIIEDGIFQAIDDAFAVTAADDGSGIVVGAGRAWFDHTWTRNDAGYPLDLEQSEVVLDRIDMVVLEVDSSSPVRNNTIKIVKGTPSSNPTKPSPANTETLHQHPLAYLTRPAGTETITQSQIESVIGTEECPFVTGPLKTISADAMLAQWQAEFDEWFESLEDTLSGDVAANLANQIMQKVDKTNVLDTVEEIEATTEEGYVAGALAAKDMVYLEDILEFEEVGAYTYRCFIYRIRGSRYARIFGRFHVASVSGIAMSPLTYGSITNPRLSPNDARVSVVDIFGYNATAFDCAGIFTLNHVDGLKTSTLDSGVRVVVADRINYYLTSPPRSITVGWELFCKLYPLPDET